MGRGRPPSGPALVDRLEGSPQAKTRLRIILETVSGVCSIPAACAALGLSEAAFYRLRERTLTEAVAGLEPRPAGRPSLKASPEAEQVQALTREVARLEMDLHAARVREEIALTMPHLLARRRSPRAAGPKRGEPHHGPTGR